MAEPFFKISDSWADIQAVFPSGAPWRNALNGVTFLLVMQGHGTVEIDHREFALREGLLLTVLPYHLLQMKASEGLKCRLLAFEFEYLSAFPFLLRSQLSEKIEAMPAVLLGKEARRLLVKHYDAIAAHHLRSSHASYREIMQALLFIWVAEINEIYLHNPLKPIATPHENIADQFFQLLHAHVFSRRDLSFYAGCLCLSAKHLSRVIKQATGHTPSFWIADFTIKEAKAHLKSSRLTVTQLSDLLNFPNSSFFARYFKRHTGMSPQEYREKG